jgi:hypothetical protein
VKGTNLLESFFDIVELSTGEKRTVLTKTMVKLLLIAITIRIGNTTMKVMTLWTQVRMKNIII